MFTHFSGGRCEPREAPARKCSECGHELYADEDLICQECLDADNAIATNHGGNDDN